LISAANPAAGDAELRITSPVRYRTTTTPPPVGIVSEAQAASVVGGAELVGASGAVDVDDPSEMVVTVVPGSPVDVVAISVLDVTEPDRGAAT
jgi:hypothetical protein